MSFENNAHKASYKIYFLLTAEIKYYNVMIHGKNFFDKIIKNDQRTYNKIRRITTRQRDDYTTGCLLHYVYFKNYYNIAVDLKVVSATFLLVCFSSLKEYLWNLEKCLLFHIRISFHSPEKWILVF